MDRTTADAVRQSSESLIAVPRRTPDPISRSWVFRVVPHQSGARRNDVHGTEILRVLGDKMAARVEHEDAQQTLLPIAINLLGAVCSEHARTDDNHVERRTTIGED